MLSENDAYHPIRRYLRIFIITGCITNNFEYPRDVSVGFFACYGFKIPKNRQYMNGFSSVGLNDR